MGSVNTYSLGLDFGTESVRALVVDCATGDEAAESVVDYPHGVITKDLPIDFALQDARDYVDCSTAAIKQALEHVSADSIAGIGVDFTACTILPIKKDGTPLMWLEEYRENRHSWVKLWKHHAAQPEADRVNMKAKERGEKFLQYYGGLISCEWMLPKCFEIYRHAPEIYAAADLIIDAGDWFVHQMTDQFTRNSCAAGYKGLWNAELGFPSKDFLAALDPGLKDLDSKWVKNIVAPGKLAGHITRKYAEITGLKKGTPVSAATIDAHSGVAGMGVYREGPMCLIMGTSTCHMVLSRELKLFDGYGGVTKDGIIPGFYGYESGQSAVGDIFAWFAKRFVKADFHELSFKAAALNPGQSGVVALDWMNGNRSILMNSNLSGAIIGLTLDIKPEEVYRALIEATAFGTKKIIETHINANVPVTELVVCGGLIKDHFIMQIYADVTGLPVRVAHSSQAVALGAAVFGALAAFGGDPGEHIESVITKMTKPAVHVYEPRSTAVAVYQELYESYLELHDYFGRSNSGLMKRLKRGTRQ